MFYRINIRGEYNDFCGSKLATTKNMWIRNEGPNLWYKNTDEFRDRYPRAVKARGYDFIDNLLPTKRQ